MKYGKKRTYGKRKATRRPRAPRAKVSDSVRKYVKTAIHRSIENKVATSVGVNQSIITANPSFSPYFLDLLPRPSQATGHAGRIGNEIRLVNAYIRGRINIIPYNAVTNPIPTPLLVKMWLCSNKVSNNPQMNVLSTFSTFFDTGNVNSIFQGNALDMILSPNKDAWTVHKTKSIKLGAAYASSTGPVNTAGYFDNSAMSVPFSFPISQYVKTLKYDDVTAF